MAWQVSKRVWDSIKTDKKKRIDSSERLMLLALADKADESGICLPKYDTSYQTLGDMVGVNRRSAMRLVDNLAQAGHIWKSEVAGRGHSNTFIITIGLSEAEIKDRLALIGVTDDTIKEPEKVLPETPISEPEKEMVLPVTQKGVMDDTNKALNGVMDNTQSILKSPSIPTDSPKGVGLSPTKPDQKSKSKGPTESQAMFKALVDLCKYDLELLTEKDRGRLNQFEKRMRTRQLKPDDIREFECWWYSCDWRGQKDQAPTLDDLYHNWRKFEAFKSGEKGGSNPQGGAYKNGHKPQSKNQTKQSGPISRDEWEREIKSL